MNIKKKYQIIEGIEEFFFKEVEVLLIQKVKVLLENTIHDYDVEVCIFYRDGLLHPKCKFQIFTDSEELLTQLLRLISIENYDFLRWKNPLKWIQFVFNKNGNIIEYALNHVSYTNETVIDISYKTFIWEQSLVREYIHRFPKNYINDIAITRFRDVFLIKDIILLQKKFFEEKISSCYLFFVSNSYFPDIFEKEFDIVIPDFIKWYNMKCFCICMNKAELTSKIPSKFSLYFWTYWM